MNNQPIANKKPMVGTNGVFYYGDNLKENVSLAVKYLESNLLVGIYPLLPEGKQMVNSKYDYKAGNEIYLKGKTAKSLARCLKKATEERDAGEKIKSRAVSSAANLIEVSGGDKFGADSKSIIVTIYNDLNPETKKSSNRSIFRFRDEVIINDYNGNDGSYEEGRIDADIDYFIEQLREFSKSINNAVAHSIKKEMKYDMDKIISRQIQMMDALGIKSETLSSSRLDWSNNQKNNSSSSVVNVETSEDLMSELENLK